MKIKKTIAIIVLICLLIIDGMIVFELLKPKKRVYYGVIKYKHTLLTKYDSQFTQFENNQSGTRVKELIDLLVYNMNELWEDTENNTYLVDFLGEDVRYPDLIIETSLGKGGYITSLECEKNKKAFNNIKKEIDENHNYYIELVKRPYMEVTDLIIVSYNEGDFSHIKEEQYRIDSYDRKKGYEHKIDFTLFGGTAFDKKHKEPSAMNVISK